MYKDSRRRNTKRAVYATKHKADMLGKAMRMMKVGKPILLNNIEMAKVPIARKQKLSN